MALLKKLWSGADFWDKQENKKQRDQFAQQQAQQPQGKPLWQQAVQQATNLPGVSAARNIPVINKAISATETGLARSLTGGAQGISGLYDLASPGKGTNRFTKATQTMGAQQDQFVKNNGLNRALYKGGQLGGEVLQFVVPGMAVDALAGANKVGKVVQGGRDIKAGAGLLPNASNFATKGLNWVTKPANLANIATNTIQNAGYRTAQGQDNNLKTLGTDLATSVAFGGALEGAGKGVSFVGNKVQANLANRIARSPRPLTTDYRQAVANYLNTADRLIAEAGTPQPAGLRIVDNSVPQQATTQLGQIDNPLPVAPDALNLKNKQTKATFMQTTNQHLGSIEAAKTNNISIARALPKLDSNQSLGLMDSLENGIGTGDFSGAPTQVRSILESKYKQLTDAGVDIGYLENYFPHKWANATQDQVNQAYQVLNLRAGIQNPRAIPTISEGISLGFKPLTTDYRLAVANYLNTADRLIANKQYFDDLRSKGLIAEAGTRPQGMQLIDAPGLPQPRPFTDPVSGNQVQGGYYARPDVAKKLNGMFGDKSPANGFEKVLDKAARISAKIQDFRLSGGIPGTPVNAFTIAQGTKEVLSGNFKSSFVAMMKSFNAKSANEYFAKHASDIAEMQSKGIPVKSGFSIDAKTLGKDLSEASGIKDKTKVLWEHAFNDPTFQRFMPILQTEMYAKIKAKHGADVAAQAVKNFYGITDMATQATRSKVGNDFATTTLFAPKYRESMVNFWKQNAKALAHPTDPAYRQNLKFVAGALMAYAAQDFANQYYNDGAHMWDNPDGKKDKALLGTVGGKQVGVPFLSSIATVPRNVGSLGYSLATLNMDQAGKDIGSFLSTSIKPVVDLANNENYFGSQIVKDGASAPERAGQVGSYLLGQYNHPFIEQGFNVAANKLPEGIKKFTNAKAQSPIETASKASELPFRFYDQSAYKFGGTGMDKNQKETYSQLPVNDRKSFQQQAIDYNKSVKISNKEKDTIKNSSSDAKQLSDGSFYGKVDGKFKTFDSKEEYNLAKAKSDFKKSGEKVKTIGDTVYQKRKDGTIFTKDKTEYEYDKGASKRKLTMDRASAANDLNAWASTAEEEYNALEKLKSKYDAETEQDKIDAITLKQENLQDKLDGYITKGYIRKGGKGGKGSKVDLSLLTKAKAVETPKIRKSNLSVKAPTMPKMASVKTPRVASRPRNTANVTSRKTYLA